MASSSQQRTTSRSSDLRSADITQVLSWKGAPDSAWIGEVFAEVDKICTEGIEWYLAKKNKKRRGGQWLRLLAIGLGTIAGIVPALASSLEATTGQTIPAGLATVAAALAAMLIAFDRFGDLTGGWVRYVRAAQALDSLQTSKRHAWLRLQYRLQHAAAEKEREAARTQVGDGAPPSAPVDIASEALECCRTYAERTKQLVRDETDKWASAFGQALDEVSRVFDDERRNGARV